MKIFDKRPLSLILCILLGAFVIYSNAGILASIVTAVICLLIFISTFIFPRAFGNKLSVIRIISSLTIPTIIFSFVYFEYYFKAYERFAGEEIEISGTVTDIDKSVSTYYDLAVIDADSVSGEAFSSYKFIAYLAKEDSVEISDSTAVVIHGTLTDFVGDSSYRFAEGYSATISTITSIEVIEYKEPGILHAFKDFRRSITRYVVYVSDDKYAGGLFAALLTGDRDYISPSLESDFMRTGITHILALSGMHFVIISISIGKMLSIMRIGKKTRTLLTAIFALLYMALTGFTATVTRAGIMLLISSVLYLLSHTHDSITSLFVSVAIVCLVEPYAIYDLALWLSAFATLGVLVAYEAYAEYTKNKSLPYRIIRYILISFVSSTFAIGATMLISNIAFGRISIISPLATLVFGVLSELYTYLGIFMLISSIFVSGIPMLTPLYSVIAKLAEVFSSIKSIYVFSDFTAVTVLTVILTLSIMAFMIFKIKYKRIATVVIATLMLSVFVTSYYMTTSGLKNDGIEYYAKECSDSFLIKNNKKVCYIDSCTYSRDTAYTTLQMLNDQRVPELQLYVLTAYYKSLPITLETMLSGTKIETVCIPAPQNRTEETIAEGAEAVCGEYGSTLIYANYNTPVVIEDFSFNSVYRTPYGDEAQRYAYKIQFSENIYTYISSGLFEEDTLRYAEMALHESYALILGEHGKSYSDTFAFGYKLKDVKTIIFNSNDVTLDQRYMEHYLPQGTDVLYDITYIKLTD